ncbi:hypothetical protein ACSZOC_09945 [Aeromonas hydrophila]
MQLTLEQGWHQQRQQVEQLKAQHQQWGAWLEEHKELAPVARQWQPLLTAMQDWAEEADRLQQLLTLREHKLRALRQLQHQLEQGQQERDYWQREQERLQQQQHELQEQQWEGRLAKAQEQWQGQTEQLGQLRQLLELADYGRNHGEQHGRLQQEITQLEQALGKLAILGDELTPARERLACNGTRRATRWSSPVPSPVLSSIATFCVTVNLARSAAPRSIPITRASHRWRAFWGNWRSASAAWSSSGSGSITNTFSARASARSWLASWRCASSICLSWRRAPNS